MTAVRRIIAVGLDGLDPGLAERMMDAGALPHLASLRSTGGFARLATTTPAQTPVAWSTFATGANPGEHGIYDFLHRDPHTYLPNLALTRYEQRSALLPPRAVNLRGGVPVWERLSAAGVPSTILRCPCTYPPEPFKGRLLAGMGVPDVRGGLGTSTFFTTDHTAVERDGEHLTLLSGSGPVFSTALLGPRAGPHRDLSAPIRLTVDARFDNVRVEIEGADQSATLRPGEWSAWQRVRFKTGLLRAVPGIVRFLLIVVTPHVVLYASPVNFDPASPPFPISHPAGYGRELESSLGLYHTLGMPEDHTGLTNGRFAEDAFIAQCDDVMREREAMLRLELDRLREGLLFCLFDTPDRIQHMFWRFREPDHPANAVHGYQPEYVRVIEDHYARCDRIVGEVLRAADDRTLVMVLSDHGFTSFRRGVHLNAWLAANGWLALRAGVDPGAVSEFFRHVDWSCTRAYALGFGSVYLNVAGREAEGIVPAGERRGEAARLASQLAGFVDPGRGEVAVRGARVREELYHGARESEAPDVVVEFAPGYRASWATALGGLGGGLEPRGPGAASAGLCEDNTRKWGGDHIIDPLLVPGVLFMNRALGHPDPRLADCTATILDSLGVEVPAPVEGRTLVG